MGVLDDLREKNKNTLNEKEKILSNAQKTTAKKTVKKIPQRPQKIPESPQRKERKRNGQQSISRHRLGERARAVQEDAIKENAYPQAVLRFSERVINDGVLAPVSIPYQIASGKKLLDFGLEAESERAQKGAAVGNFLGTAATYGTGYGAAGKAIGKGAGKILATDTAKKGVAKLAASKVGQKAGKEAVEKVAEGIARNIVGDATVGTVMNLSSARGEGLKGKALAENMAVNAAMDFGLGNAFEFVPMAWKAGKNAIKDRKLQTRIVDGKVKNVWTKTPEVIPQAPNTYKVKPTGSVSQRAGLRQMEEAVGNAQAPKTIPYAPGKGPKTLTSEAEEKVFRAVEQRSGAKITFADLPEGVDGTYQNGVITISNKASNPAYTVLKHELTHHIETSGHYAELSDFIQNSMRDAGYNVDQSINDIISDYARMGKNLTAEEAQKEFTAKFAEEYLFNSEKSIERLARENPNIFRQIYDWIVDTIHKIGASEETKFLIDAQRKYEKALRTVGKTEDAGTKYMFYKASAEDALKAEQLKAAGASEAEIKKRLNLHQDARGEWVSELSDQGAKLYRGFDAKLYNANPDYRRYADMWKTGDIFNPEFAKLDEIYRNVVKNEGNLDQILDHEALFEKYPQLRRTSVRFENLEEGINGGFNPYTKQIVLSEDLYGDDTMSTLLHEVQHNVQTLDGRNNGNTVAFAADNIKARQRFAQRQEKEASNALETLVGEPLDILMTQAKQSGIREDIDSMWEAEDICRAMRKHFENIGDTAAVERVDAFTKLYADLTDRINKSFIEVLYWKGMSPTEAYLKTSGEVEARQTASSRFFSEQDRRNRVPEKGIDLEGAGYSQNYVGTRSDGIEVYETSPEVKNLPTKEKINLFKQNMTEKYRGRTARFTKNGETYYAKFDDADVKKNIYGDKKSDKNGKKAKLNTGADGDTFDLIENSTYQSNSTEKGKTGSAHEGVENWDYYIKSVQIDGKVFDEVVNIRVKQNGEYVYSIQLNQNKKTPALPPAPAYNDKSQMATLKIGETTDAMDSIEPGTQNVKQKTDSSTGRSLQKDELLNRLQKTSENLYGETGNKYLQDIPPAPAKKKTQNIPYDQKTEPQPIPHADTIPKTRKTASEAPDITTDERWDYMLENAPGERHARKLTEEEWSGVEMQGQQEAKARSGVTDDQIDAFLNREPKTEVKASQKSKQYQNRKIRAADQKIRQALGINKYSDNKYIKDQMNQAMEKMKDGTLTKADKDKLFNEMFAEGIVVDQDFALRYQDLKQTIRSTQLNIPERVRKNIADFDDFRRSHMNKVRMSNTEGASIDTFYDELRNSYPELFPEVNAPEEMLETIADVADSIKVAEKRVSAEADADEIYEEARKKFDEVMDNLEREANIVKQYVTKRETDLTTDEMLEFAGQLGRMKRNAEKVKGKVLLSEKDRKFKDMLLDGRMTPDDVRKASLNSQNIFEVYNAEKPVYEMKKTIKEYGQQTKDTYKDIADKVLESSDNWKDKIGFSYARETPERNFVDIAGKKAGEKINRAFITPIHEHEAVSTKMKTALREEVKTLNVSTKKTYDATKLSLDAPGLSEQVNQARGAGKQYKISEAEIVQLYGEGLIDKEAINSLGADFGKIQKSVDTMRKLYNQLLEAANNELLRHGYEPIEFRKDYFPHFTEEKPDGILAKAAAALGIDIKKEELPTDINGLTHTFRPGKKWFGHALQRTSKVTEYDAIKGFDIYLEGISDVIHHTEDIQKLRALESELRFKYSDDGIKDRIRKIKNSDMDDSIKDELMRSIYDTGNTQLGSLATWLRNYTDQLAGKKSQFDRVFEQALGRTMYNSSKAVENRIAANMVALNPGSWLTNFIPLVQAGELSPKYILQGMAETVQNGFRKTDNVADISSFLTNRKGSDVLWKSGSEKVQNVLTKPMEWIDTFTSQALVRAKYAEQVAKGVNPEDAIQTADRFAADIIADRSKGALPTMFNSKNPISKILTMYQVEVNNQWSHLLKDIPKSKENVAKVALAFTNFAVGAYIFNDVYERFVGRRPALDPISWVNDYVGDTTGKKLPNFTEALQAAMKGEGFALEETKPKKGGAAITAIGENVAQDIPFVGGVLNGGRVPISSALPSATTITTNLGNLGSGDVAPEKAWSAIGKELAKPATYIFPPVGGGQIKKIVESGIALKKGGSYGMDNDGNKKLRFAVDTNPLDVAKGLLFGQYAIGNAQEYVDSGFKMLSADKTKAYQALVDAGMKNTEAERFIRSLPSKSTEMRTAILDSNLTAKQKQAVGRILDNKHDYTSRKSYSDSLMSDRQKEAVAKLTKSGMSDTDAKKVYELTKESKSGAEQVNALLEAGYHEEVMKKLGLGEKSIERGKALHAAGIENEIYVYNKKRADANGSGNVSIQEAREYLEKTAYTRKEKFALVKALTGCADKNNPYR